MTQGFKKQTTYNSELNLLSFILKNNLSLIRTAFLAEVISVDNDTVDVLPLTTVEPAIIYNIPYFIYQAGTNSIRITPEKGDYGLCVVSDRDISKLKNTKKRSNPNSHRRFDVRDSLYLGSFINRKEPKNHITIDSDRGINITSESNINVNCRKANIKSDIINIESNDNTTISSNNSINIKANSVTLDSDNINLGSNPIRASVLTTNAVITSPSGICTIANVGSGGVKAE